MKMWYAVKRNGKGSLYADKPQRLSFEWFAQQGFLNDDNGFWADNIPELKNRTWKDEPLQVEICLADATKKEPTVMQKLKAAITSTFALALIAIFYIAYIPVGILRAIVDLDRFSDFVDALMEMVVDIRLAWRKAIRKVKGGE